MSRRNISLNFRRRILATISSLFQRRWVAPIRSTRRSRWSQRIREFSDRLRAATAKSTKLVNTHLLTLTPSEFLERRALTTIDTNLGGSTSGLGQTSPDLYVWMDGQDDRVYLRQLDNSKFEVASDPGFTSPVYNGGVPGQIRVFDAVGTLRTGPTTGGLTIASGGSGYTQLQNLTIEDTSAVNQVQAFVRLQVNAATPTPTISGTFVNGTYTTSITLSDGNGSANYAVAIVPGTGTGVIQSVTYDGATSTAPANFGRLTSLSATGTNLSGGSATTNGSLSPTINYLNFSQAGLGSSLSYDRGYFATPNVTVPGTGGGSGGNVSATLINNRANTGVIITEFAGTPFAPSLRVGSEANGNGSGTGDVETFYLGARSQNGVAVTRADMITIAAPIDSVAATGNNSVFLSLAANAAGRIDIQTDINAPSVYVDSSTGIGAPGGTVTATGNMIRATAGGVTVISSNAAGLTLQSGFRATGGITLDSQAGILQTYGSLNGGSVSLNAPANVFANSPLIQSADFFRVNSQFASVYLTGQDITTAGATGIVVTAAHEVRFEADADAGTSVAADIDIRTTRGIFLNGTLTASDLIFARSAQNAISIGGNLTTATTGNVALQALDPTNGTVAGLGNITARGLTILTGSTTSPMNIVSNVSTVAINVGSGLTLVNARSLVIDQGFTVVNGGVSITTTGIGSNLALNQPLVLRGANANLSLVASGSITGTASQNVPGNLVLQSTGGSINVPTQIQVGGGRLDAIAATGITLGTNVTASAINLGTVSGGIFIETQPVAGTGNVIFSNAIAGSGNVTLGARAGNLVVAGQAGSGTGNVTLRSYGGDVNLATGSNVSAPAGTVSLITPQSVLLDPGNNYSVNAATLNYSAPASSTLLNTATYSALSARITGANNPLSISRSTSLDVVAANTANGLITIDLSNGNLSVSGGINAGSSDVTLNVASGKLTTSNALVGTNISATASDNVSLGGFLNASRPSGTVTLTSTAGGIAASSLITGQNLSVTAFNNSSIASANVARVTGSVTGANQGLTAGFTSNVAIGAANLASNGGAVGLTLTTGNLTRTGAINAAGGSLTINVGSNGILGNGVINTRLLDWTANAAPSATNLSYSVLTANQTGAGNLAVNAATSLEVRSISIASGQIAVNLSAGNLTINGPINSRAGITNIALAAPAGSIGLGNSTGNITADVLTVSAQNDVALRTNVATLVANVTTGSFAVTENSGLTIGAAGAVAADNVSITVLSGNLDRSGPIQAGAGDTVTLSVPGGAINGATGVTAAGGTLIWTALNTPADTQLTGAGDYANLSAAVTGVGQNLTLQRAAGDLTVLGATTTNGRVTVAVDTGFLFINGPVTAGGANEVYLYAGNAIETGNAAVGNSPNVVTGGYVYVNAAFEPSTLRLNAAVLEGDINSSATIFTNSGLGIGRPANGGATGLVISDDLTLSVNGSLALTGPLSATGANVRIGVTNGGISGAGLISAGGLNVTSQQTANMQVNLPGAGVGNFIAAVTGGDLVVNATGFLEVTNVVASGNVSLTAVESINGSQAAATHNVVAQTGNVTLVSGNLVTFDDTGDNVQGNLLMLRADGVTAASSILGNVSSLTANVASGLTFNQGAGAANRSLIITANGIVAGGMVTVNARDLSLVGGINTTGNVDIVITGGATGAGVVTGNKLRIAAVNTTSIATNVVSVFGNVSGGSLTITEADNLAIDAADLIARDNLNIQAGGGINGAGSLTAGSNITLTATNEITLNTAGQVQSTGNGVLTLTAGGNSNLGINVGAVNAVVTGNLALAEIDTLNVTGVRVSGLFDLDVADDLTISGTVNAATVDITSAAGSITGNGTVTANGTGNVTIAAAGGGVDLSLAGQIVGNVLTVTALDGIVLGTNVNTLNAASAIDKLTVTETNGLSLIRASAGDELSITLSAGSLTGDGQIIAVSNDVTLNVAGSINLASNTTARQVLAGDLNVVAGGSATLNTSVDSLNATVTGGDLTIVEANGLTIDGSVTAAGNVVSITFGAAHTLDGVGLISASDVRLTGNAVDLTAQAVPAPITAGILRLAINNDADLVTGVTNITGTVGGTLTVTEANGLNIGLNATDTLRAGNLDLTLTMGGLSGPGNLNLAGPTNVAGNATIAVQDATGGSITLNQRAEQVRGFKVDATTLTGSIALNTAVSNLSAATFSQNGNVTVNQNGSLSIETIDTVNGSVAVTVANGNLRIGVADGDQGILGGQLSSVTLNVQNGSISTDGVAFDGLITGSTLTLLAQNSSSVNTTVTTLVATLTGNGQSLTVFESEFANTTVSARSVNAAADLLELPTVDFANGTLVRLSSGNDAGLNTGINYFVNEIGAGTRQYALFNSAANAAANAAGNGATGLVNITANLTGIVNLSSPAVRDGLTIAAAGVVTNNGHVSITLEDDAASDVYAGNLVVTGSITAGTGNVTLTTANGSITGAGTVLGNALNLTAAHSSALNTSATSLTAAISGEGQSLTINEASALTINVGGVSTANGAVLITARGTINGTGEIDASNATGQQNTAGSVTLNATAAGAGISLSANTITANLLTLNAATDTTVNTTVANVTATVTTAGNLTIQEADDLNVAAAGLSVASGNLSVNLAGGHLAGTGNVTVTGTAVTTASANGVNAATDLINMPSAVFANGTLLTLSSGNDAGLNTGISYFVNRIGAGTNYALFSSAANAAANAANGSTTGLVNLTANSSVVSLSTVSNGVATLNASAGNITLNGANQVVVTGTGLLSIVSGGDTSVNTSVVALRANVGGNLTVFENSSLNVDAGNVVADNVALTLAGNLAGSGNINASERVTITAPTGNVTLTGQNQVTGNALVLLAQNTSSLNTSVNFLAANVTSGSLTVVEADGVTINAAGVIADTVSIRTRTTGDMTIASTNATSVNASTVDAATDLINLPGTGFANGTLLTLTTGSDAGLTTSTGYFVARLDPSTTSYALFDSFANAVANAGGSTAGIVNLTANAAVVTLRTPNNGVVARTGTVDLTVATGLLDGWGFVSANAGASNVSLSAALGEVTLNTSASQVLANRLTLTAKDQSAVNTAITSIAASVTGGGLTVFEANDLSIAPAGVTTAGSTGNDLSITLVANGSTLLGGPRSPDTVSASSVNAAGDLINLPTAGFANGTQVRLSGANQAGLNTGVDYFVNRISPNGTLYALFNSAANAASNAGNSAITTGLVNLTANASVVNLSTVSGRINVGGGDATITAVNGTVSIGDIRLVTDASFVGWITADSLTINAATINVDTNVGSIAVSGASTLTVREQNNLNIGTANVVVSGDITLQAVNGIADDGANARITSTLGNVTLLSVNNGITLNSAANQVTGNVISLTANSTSSVETNSNAVLANITGPGQSLTIVEGSGDLVVDGRNIVTNNGSIDLSVAAGNLVLTGGLTAGTGSISLAALTGNVSGSGLVSGDRLELTARDSTSLNTTVGSINASITGLGSTLDIVETDGLTIGFNDVVSNKGRISIRAGGTIVGADVTIASANTVNAATDLINLPTATFANGTLLRLTSGNDAGLNTGISYYVNRFGAGTNYALFNSFANASQNAVGVAVTSVNASVDLINIPTSTFANGTLLTLRSASDSNLTSGVGYYVNRIGAGNNYALFDSAANAAANAAGPSINGIRDLTANTAVLTFSPAAGLVNLTANTSVVTLSTVETGDIDASNGGVGDSSAGSVTLNSTGGGVTVAGMITANNLTVLAAAASSVSTEVANISGSVTGGLTVVEADDLNIAAAGLRVSGGDLSIRSNTGILGGPGVVNVTGDATLNTPAGGITLNSVPSQVVVSGLLSLKAADPTFVNTSAVQLTANITAGGLTVIESDSLTIAAGKVVATDTISITSGSLVLTGGINANNGTDSVSLNVTGTVSGSGQILAEQLDLVSTGAASVNTSINTLNATVTSGRLSVTEANNLTVVNATAQGDINLSLPGFLLNAAGPTNFITSTAGNVALTAATVVLNDVARLVSGNVLSLNVTGTADLETNVAGLTASSSGTRLTLNEVNDLSIGAAGVTGPAGASIAITTGGNLARTGVINASPTGLVTLSVGGGISGNGRITANKLDATSTQSATLVTNIAFLNAAVTGLGQSLAVSEADDLVIEAGNSVTTNNGPISITAGGAIAIHDVLSAGSGTMTLIANGGGVNVDAAATPLVASTLTVRALGDSTLFTTVGALAANITGAGNTLTVSEDDGLTIASVVTNNGDVDIEAGFVTPAVLTLAGSVNAGSGDISLRANAIQGGGSITGDGLNVVVARSSALATNVNTVDGVINGAGQILTITDASGIGIGAAGLTATGANGRITVNANGAIDGAGNIYSNSSLGAVVLNATGNLNMTGSINAARVTLLAGGSVTLNQAAGQVGGDTLFFNAVGATRLNTAVSTISGFVTGANNTLTVIENDGLSVASNGLVTNNGAITLIGSQVANGPLSLQGPVNAVGNTVTLRNLGNTSSTINSSGVVTGSTLTVNASNNVSLRTNVTTVVAGLASNGSLTINEADTLVLGNVSVANGGVNVSVLSGNLTGTGNSITVSGDVTLAANAGAINLTGRISGNVLTASANGSLSLNTAVSGLNVTLLGAGSALNVVELDNLSLGLITTNNGGVSIRSTSGNLTGSGNLSAGTADVSLNAARGISLTGTIAANNLTLLAANGSASVVTNVVGITGRATNGSITVTEANNLTVLAGGLNASTAGNDVTVTAGGVINGTGSVIAANLVTLNAASGVTLTAVAGQVRAAALTVLGGGTTTVNTNVTTLTANTSGSLAVTETSSLTIGAAGVSTALGNGNIAITLSRGDLNGTGVVNAGTGSVTLAVPSGSIVLNSANVTGSQLVATAKSGIDVLTNVALLDASTATGNIRVVEADSITVNTASAARGSVTINAAGDIETRSVNGRTGVSFSTPANVSINGALVTSSTLNLALVGGNVTVLPAGSIATGRSSGVINQATGNGVIWQVNSNADSGLGTLRNAITGVNSFQGRSQLMLNNLSVNLTSALPAVTRQLRISGSNVTLDGGSRAITGLTLAADGTTVDNIALRNFGGPAIYLAGGRAAGVDIDVSNLTITGSTIGIQAVSFLTGSTISSTTISGTNAAGSYGIMLSNVRGLAVGDSTQNSVRVSNVAIGLSATGTLTGSSINGLDVRSLAAGGYGISLVSAKDLTVTSARNMISDAAVGVFASGFSTGTKVSNLMFGTGVTTRFNVSNSRNLVATAN